MLAWELDGGERSASRSGRLDRMLGGPQSLSGHCGEEESLLPLLGNSKRRLYLIKTVKCTLYRFTVFDLLNRRLNTNASRKSGRKSSPLHMRRIRLCSCSSRFGPIFQYFNPSSE
jgi:hypothetical protein